MKTAPKKPVSLVLALAFLAAASCAQATTLNGITYMMELSDDAKTARFFTNVWLENNE